MNTLADLDLPALAHLSRDLRSSALLLGRAEIRSLVDLYYAVQELRKATANQARALLASDEPSSLSQHFAQQMGTIEDQVKAALDTWSAGHPVGEWCRAQHGIGPVTTAGLLAHIDISRAPTVGHIWRFAGLDPTVRWRKGEKRPWNS